MELCGRGKLAREVGEPDSTVWLEMGSLEQAVSRQMRDDLPGACCNIRNARVRGQRWDVWVQVESKGVLPEIILVVKPVTRSWSTSLARHRDLARDLPRARVCVALEHITVIFTRCHCLDISRLPSDYDPPRFVGPLVLKCETIAVHRRRKFAR